jgi:hypothetical protein
MRPELARRRAEAMLRDPPMFGAFGPIGAAVREIRDEAQAALDDADARLRQAAIDRMAAADRIRLANRALAGHGRIIDAHGNEVQYLRRRTLQAREPVVEPEGLDVLRGEALRDALVDLLVTIGTPVTVNDLHRFLVAHGFTVAGRPSRTISNALGVEVRAGTVRRVARGRYEAVPALVDLLGVDRHTAFDR